MMYGLNVRFLFTQAVSSMPDRPFFPLHPYRSWPSEKGGQFSSCHKHQHQNSMTSLMVASPAQHATTTASTMDAAQNDRYMNTPGPSIADDGSSNDRKNSFVRSSENTEPTINEMEILRPDYDEIVPPEVVAAESIAPKDIDYLLARDLNQLSVKDRDQVYQEIHGVMDVIEEEPSMVNQRLEQLESELWRLSDEDLSAYRLAHSINPSYTTDPKFRLQFLRAERFRASTSAQRLARYFREKLALFGPEKLGKERITLDDLSDDDKEALSTGYLQWLPVRDRAGRAVHFAGVPLQHWRERSNELRACWYFLNAALEDEETQKRGIIVVHYCMARYGNKVLADDITDRRVVYHIGVLISTIPVRVESMHVCCAQLSTFVKSKILLYLTGEELRLRTRWHLGSPVEILYAIAPFGIPVEMFPVTAGGEFNLDPHHYWMEMRRQIDNQYTKEEVGGGGNCTAGSTPVSTIVSSGTDIEDDSCVSQQDSDEGGASSCQVGVVLPRPHDVLLGNLKVTQTQLGNAMFRGLVEDYRGEYEISTTKLEKIKISKKIISQIKAGGARFLKQTNYKYGKDGKIIKLDNGAKVTIGWREVPDHVARERISHAFRNLRARAPIRAAAPDPPPTSSGRLSNPFTNSSGLMNGTTVSSSSLGVYRGGSDSEGDDAFCTWGNSSGRQFSGASGCFGGGGTGRPW